MRASMVMVAWALVAAALATAFVASRSADVQPPEPDGDGAAGERETGRRADVGAAAQDAPTRGASPSRRATPRASPPGERDAAAAVEIAPSPAAAAATVEPPSVSADGGRAAAARATERRVGPPPRESVPEHASVVVAADGVRAWLVADRPPRGLVSETGSSPARLQLCLSKAATTSLVFRIESDPAGALKLVARGDPVVKVAAGRDGVGFSVAGLVAGGARVVARLVEGGDVATAPALSLALDVRSQSDFATPILDVRAEPPPEGEAADALVGGSRELLGVRGGVAGRIAVRRSGFRGFDTEPTVVHVVADDPSGVLGEVPWVVTIPAGQSGPPSPIVVRLRDAEGEAKLRFRLEDQEATVVVRSLTARWTGPARIVLPVGARAVVPLSLAPGAREMPRLNVAASDTGLAGVLVVAPSKAPAAERVDLTLEGRAPGEASLRVSAPPRPEFSTTLVVVPREIEIRAGHVVLTGLSAGARGELRLSVVRAGAGGEKKPGRLVLDDGVGVPAGVAVESGGGASMVLHLTIDAGGPAELMLPVRIDGSVEAVRVADASRGEPRTEYAIDARP